MLTADEIRAEYAKPENLQGIHAFIQKLRGRATAAAIKQALRGSDAYALNKQRVVHPSTRRVKVRGLNNVWGVDLADLSAHAAANDGIQYLLVCVDLFSRFFMVEPLRSKTAAACADGLRRILDRVAPRKPEKIWCDEGGEFKGPFATLCQQQNITIYHTGGAGKSVVAERGIKTLRGRLGRLADARGTWHYADVLQQLVDGINATVSAPIKMAPKDVTAANEAAVYEHLYGADSTPPVSTLADGAVLRTKPLFEIGDLVRISLTKHVFQKEFEANNWSRELFRVVSVVPGVPTYYGLADIDPDNTAGELQPGEVLQGTFLESELQHAEPPPADQWKIVVKGRRGRGARAEVLVSYLGWPAKYDRWVPATDVQ